MSYGQKKHANAILRSRYEEMMSGKAEFEKVRPAATAATARALNSRQLLRQLPEERCNEE